MGRYPTTDFQFQNAPGRDLSNPKVWYYYFYTKHLFLIVGSGNPG